MTKTFKKIAIHLTEWHMLKIYATVMTTALLCVWSYAMYNVAKEFIRTFF